MSPATSATKRLAELSISWVDHYYEHDARAESFGLEAAAALGVEPARVFKTLMANVADTGEKFAIALITKLADPVTSFKFVFFFIFLFLYFVS